MNNKVLDVSKEKKIDPNGAGHVLMWDSHGGDNQLWYEDGDEKIIRSLTTGFCLTSNGRLEIHSLMLFEIVYMYITDMVE